MADIHGDLDRLYRLIDSLEEKPELVVVAGDLTPFGPAELVPKIHSALKKLSPYVFMIPGNEDTREVREKMEDMGLNMHFKRKDFGDTSFIGFEGAVWLESGGEVFMKYDPLHKLLSEAPEKRKIVVSHVPPFDTEADRLWTGQHVGSPFLRSMIEEYQPDMVVCGHIHESRALDRIGRTLVLNTGALADGYAAQFDTSSPEDVTFLRIGRNKLEKLKPQAATAP